MTVLVIWALIAGQPAAAMHEFGDPGACEKTRQLVIHQIKQEGASKVFSMCSQEPS